MLSHGPEQAHMHMLIPVSQTKAGVGGQVEALARRPGLQTGKHSAHFDRIVDTRHDDIDYDLRLPLFRRSDCTRIMSDIPSKPCHEALCDFYQAEGDAIRGKLASMTMPRVYYDHPVTVAHSATTCV